MRLINKCPYRINDSKSNFHCGLVSEIAGVQLSGRTIVTEDACKACCSRFEPTKRELNPAVASVLHAFTDFVMEGESIDGCSLEKGQEIRRFAQKFLDVMPGTVDTRNKINDARIVPCFYLGGQTGERPCKSCRGNVRYKLFQCHHEQHAETIIPECEACLDYDATLKNQVIKSWAVGITTAPRVKSTLQQSLDSLEMAGWKEYEVFAEPGSCQLPKLNPKRYHARQNNLGEWSNFYLALSELVLRHPKADAYLMCQDDVIYSKGLRSYLEHHLWPNFRPGVVSLHTPMHQELEGKKGFYSLEAGWSAWGAQALVFSNPSARAFLRHPRVVSGRFQEARDGTCHVDTMVGLWCRDTKFKYFLHSPSPTQHIGEASVVWEKADLEGRRRAATFLGEEEDINDHMRDAPALT